MKNRRMFLVQSVATLALITACDADVQMKSGTNHRKSDAANATEAIAPNAVNSDGIQDSGIKVGGVEATPTSAAISPKSTTSNDDQTVEPAKDSAPIVTLTVNGQTGPVTVVADSTVKVHLETTGAKDCTLDGGVIGTSGDVDYVAAIGTDAITLVCKSVVGTPTTVTVPIVVVPPPPPAAPLATFTANGAPDPLTVVAGTMVTLVWTSENAATCSVEPGALVGLAGNATTAPLQTSVVAKLVCTNGADAVTKTIAITVAPRVTVTITANGQSAAVPIAYGQTADVAWTSAHADECVLSPGGVVDVKGTLQTPALVAATIYAITCKNAVSTADASVLISPVPPPVAHLLLNDVAGDVTIATGASLKISWTSERADSCSLSPLNETSLNGSVIVPSVSSDTTYVLDCLNLSGHAVVQATAHVAPLPVVQINVNGQTGVVVIAPTQTATLAWSSTNADQCVVAPLNFSGTSGTASIGPLSQGQTYAATCTNGYGSAMASVSVVVQTAPVTETFNGEINNVIYGNADIVFAIDTRGSLNTEKPNIQANLKAFMDQLSAKYTASGFHVWVIVDANNFSVPTGVDPALLTIIDQRVDSNKLLPSFLAFFDATLANPTPFRQDSAKQLVAVSDNDASGTTAAAFATQIAARSATAGKTAMNGFVGVTTTSTSSWCKIVNVGTQYINLSANAALGATGLVQDLCANNWDQMFSALAKSILHQVAKARFTLSQVADAAQSFVVTKNGAAVAPNDFTFDAATNAIVFATAPAAGDVVIISYHPR